MTNKMSLDNLVTGKQERPLRIVIYGVDGIGKSSFGAGAPDAIFISAEDGTAHLDVTRFQPPETWDDILSAISTLYSEDHDFRTVVLDSADWAEQIAREAVCRERNVTSIEDVGYGKGWVATQEKFSQLLRGLDALYAKGMNIIVIAHANVKTFNDPQLMEPYDRYTIKLDKRSEPLLREWADYVLFSNWDTTVTRKTDNSGKPVMGAEGKAKAKSYGKRILYTQRTAAFDAKQRFPVPVSLPLGWEPFMAAHIEASNPQPKASNA